MSESKDGDIEPPKWVVWSTRETINKNVPSLTGTLETVFAVVLYWTVAIKLETYALLALSAAISPLVLLRSDESVALGLKWFSRWETERWGTSGAVGTGAKALTASIIAGVAVGLVAYLSTAGMGGADGWGALFGRGLVAGWALAAVASAGALCAGAVNVHGGRTLAWSFPAIPIGVGLASWVAGIGAFVALFSSIAFTQWRALSTHSGLRGLLFLIALPHLLGVPIGVLGISISMRVLATLRYIIPGIRALPENFRRLAFCTSPLQEPELVPGLATGQSAFTLSGAIYQFKMKRQASAFEAYFMYPPALALWFVPAWLYRITLKSTSWFWWPLAFLGSDLKYLNKPDIIHWDITRSLWAQVTIVLSAVAVSAFVVSNLIATGAFLKDNPLLTVLGFFLIIDWTIKPWQIVGLIVPLISISLVILVNDAVGKRLIARRTRDPTLFDRTRKAFACIERLARLRLVLSVFLWVLVGSHALLYFNSLKCWLDVPPNVKAWAEWAYGDRTPKAMCSHR